MYPGEQENWRWRAGPVAAPGAAAVFDLDGVLSDAASRQHYLESGRRDWDSCSWAYGLLSTLSVDGGQPG